MVNTPSLSVTVSALVLCLLSIYATVLVRAAEVHDVSKCYGEGFHFVDDCCYDSNWEIAGKHHGCYDGYRLREFPDRNCCGAYACFECYAPTPPPTPTPTSSPTLEPLCSFSFAMPVQAPVDKPIRSTAENDYEANVALADIELWASRELVFFHNRHHDILRAVEVELKRPIYEDSEANKGTAKCSFAILFESGRVENWNRGLLGNIGLDSGSPDRRAHYTMLFNATDADTGAPLHDDPDGRRLHPAARVQDMKRLSVRCKWRSDVEVISIKVCHFIHVGIS